MASDPTAAGQPTPVPIAALLCDQVIVDQGSSKKTLVGVFDKIFIGKFPTDYRPASLYIKLIDAEGEYDVKIQYVRVNNQEILGNASGKMIAQNRNQAMEIVFPLPPLAIPVEGQYELQLWMNNKYVHRVRFDAVPKETRERA